MPLYLFICLSIYVSIYVCPHNFHRCKPPVNRLTTGVAYLQIAKGQTAGERNIFPAHCTGVINMYPCDNRRHWHSSASRKDYRLVFSVLWPCLVPWESVAVCGLWCGLSVSFERTLCIPYRIYLSIVASAWFVYNISIVPDAAHFGLCMLLQSNGSLCQSAEYITAYVCMIVRCHQLI